MRTARDLAALPLADRQRVLAGLTRDRLAQLKWEWDFWARDNQRTPPDDALGAGTTWLTWLLLAGRGFGKTRTGAEWVRERIKAGTKILGLIAPTASDIRKVMVEGPAGILAVCWEGDRTDRGEAMGRPHYEPSKTRVVWENGAVAHLYSAEEPDRLRGPQHEALWCDELATWEDAEAAWDMAMFGLRLGKKPQVCVTTTPKPIPIIRELVKSQTTVITKGTTYENRANLAPTFFQQIVRKYEGTRLGRQELEAEILGDVEGALWSRAMIVNVSRPDDIAAYAKTLARVVIAVDPPASSRGESALCGITVQGVDFKGRGKVLADLSGRMKPGEWGAAVVKAYDTYTADRIVAEGNQGGEMVAHTINTVRKGLPVSLVYAKHGKQARAEPVAALYERGVVDHIGGFPELEDQMCVAWNTLITTARGDVRASEVRASDLVLTRGGYRPLKWVGPVGVKPTFVVKTRNGYRVRLTGDHPIWVDGKGFVRADRVELGDEVLCASRASDRTSSSTASGITSTTRATTEAAGRGVIASFIAICGKRLMAPFRRAITSITSTRILGTTSWAISSVSRPPNTSSGTAPAAHGLSRVSSGQPSARRNGLAPSRDPLCAPNAAINSGQPDSAPSSAGGAAVAFSTVSAIRPAPPTEVWDLTVDGEPEFFAGGILVHNCTFEPLTGQASPDRLDALVWGLTHLQIGLGGSVITTQEDRFTVEPDKAFRQGRIPSTWRRAAGLSIGGGTVSAVWMVHDPVNDVMFLHEEYEAPKSAMAVAAKALKDKGPWVPLLFDTKENGRKENEGVRLAHAVGEFGIDLNVCEAPIEAALDMIRDRMETGRLKVLSTLTHWMQAMRGLRCDDDGEIIDENIGLIRASALLVTWGLDVAITENRAASDSNGYDPGEYQRTRNPTGY